MRRGVVIFLLVHIAVLGLLVRSVWTLLSLLVFDGADDAISRAELPAPNSTLIDGRPHLVPKIIHQTYANTSIPAHWRGPQQSCIDLHPDYEYKLWADDKARDFIEAEYPWFLETWDGYDYPIQRADSIRYFVLAHFGGIYIDLDDGCQRRLDPLLAYPAWVRKTIPTGISNDVMGAVPQHPFFLRVIDSLPQYNRHWILPYVTIMASTGPLFLSIIWRHYNHEDQPLGGDRVRILFPDEYNYHPWSFFTHNLGNSWHGRDVDLIFWMSRHWLLLTVVGLVVIAMIILVLWWIYSRMLVLSAGGRSRAKPTFSSSFLRFRLLPSWLWRFGLKSFNGGNKQYELIERHEV